MVAYSKSALRASAVANSESINKPPARAIRPRRPRQPTKSTYPFGMKPSIPIPNPIPYPYPCRRCGKCFKSQQAVNGHQNYHRHEIPVSLDEVTRLPPIRVPGRQTFENRLNYLMNPNPGNGNVGPYEPTYEEKMNLWLNAPSYYIYKYYFCNEIDYNTTLYFDNSYLRKNNIRPTGSSITAESTNNNGNKNMNSEGDEAISKPVVMVDLTRTRDGR